MMRKNEEISKSRPGFTHTLYMILAAVLFAGVLAGSLSLKSMTSEEFLSLGQMADGFLENRSVQPFYKTFLASFQSALLPALICMVMGFCAVGQPLAIAAVFFRGAGLGASVASLYSQYGIQGFWIALLLILLPAMLSSGALLMSARESIRLSAIYFRFGFLGKETRSPDFRLYLLKFAILLVIILLSAFLDGILSLLFAGAVIPM